LALEGLSAGERDRLIAAVADEAKPAAERIHSVRDVYQAQGVFDKAMRLVEKHQQRAEAIADEIEPEALRRLFYYLIDTVLERDHDTSTVPPEVIIPTITTNNL
jgi:hypothetical protein